MKHTTLRNALVTLSSFIFVVGIVTAWTGPSTNPPNGNTDAPINASSSAQVKLGALGVGALDSAGSVRIGTTATACSVLNGGAIRWVDASLGFEYCNKTAWVPFGGGGGGNNYLCVCHGNGSGNGQIGGYATPKGGSGSGWGTRGWVQATSTDLSGQKCTLPEYDWLIWECGKVGSASGSGSTGSTGDGNSCFEFDVKVDSDPMMTGGIGWLRFVGTGGFLEKSGSDYYWTGNMYKKGTTFPGIERGILTITRQYTIDYYQTGWMLYAPHWLVKNPTKCDTTPVTEVVTSEDGWTQYMAAQGFSSWPSVVGAKHPTYPAVIVALPIYAVGDGVSNTTITYGNTFHSCTYSRSTGALSTSYNVNSCPTLVRDGRKYQQ